MNNIVKCYDASCGHVITPFLVLVCPGCLQWLQVLWRFAGLHMSVFDTEQATPLFVKTVVDKQYPCINPHKTDGFHHRSTLVLLSPSGCRIGGKASLSGEDFKKLKVVGGESQYFLKVTVPGWSA